MTPTVIVDRECATVTVDGVVLRPPRMTFLLIAFLLERPGRICTQDNIINAIGCSFSDPRNASNQIRRARDLLRTACPDHSFIITRPGLGYQWRTE